MGGLEGHVRTLALILCENGKLLKSSEQRIDMIQPLVLERNHWLLGWEDCQE